MQKTKRQLEYKFTEEEIKERSKQLAYECRQVVQLQEQKKEVMSDFKAKIDAKDSLIAALSNNVNNGWEYRTIDCEIEMDTPKKGMKTITRTDTGEEVAKEKMTDDDRQEELPLDMQQAGRKFKNEMQDIVDKGGMDSISISSPSFKDGEEIVIAKKRGKK